MKHQESYCGDPVKVRSSSENLATLGESSVLGGLSFMQEMIVYCVRRLTVDRRADSARAPFFYIGSSASTKASSGHA